MARSSTTFKKGQVANPKGRPPLTPEQKAAREAFREMGPDFVRVLKELLATGEERTRKDIALTGIKELGLGEPQQVEVRAQVQAGPLDDATAEKVAAVLDELREREGT